MLNDNGTLRLNIGEYVRVSGAVVEIDPEQVVDLYHLFATDRWRRIVELTRHRLDLDHDLEDMFENPRYAR